MIVRQLIRANGRVSSRAARRFLATTTPDASKSLPEAGVLSSIGNHGSEIAAPDSIAEDYQEFKRQKLLLGHLGATVGPHYQPHTLVANPPRPSDITLELLLASQSHLGHATALWNPANARYIFGIRDGIHIISLEVTAAHLRRAAKVVTAVAERGGLILFAGTRSGQDTCVVKAATLAGGCHLFERWIPGSITNGLQILGRCKLKVVDELDNEVEGFDQQLIERESLKPDLVVCLNPLENWVLLHECALNNIPTIGIIDTDANPTWVTYPIPANDDSLRCAQVICGVLGRAAEQGRQRRLQLAQDNSLRPQQRITFEPASKLVAPGSESGKDLLDENVLRLMPTIQDMEELDAKIAEKRAMMEMKKKEKMAEHKGIEAKRIEAKAVEAKAVEAKAVEAKAQAPPP